MSPKLQASKGGRVEEDRDERTRVEASGGSFAGSRRRLDVGGSGGADGGELSAGKRLWKRYRVEGPRGLVHGSAGRVSNRAKPKKLRRRVLQLIRTKYSGEPGKRFGPTLAAEHLAEEDGIELGVETLRRWMLEEGLWSRERRRRAHRRRRERKAHFGEMVQLDGSFHDWLEGRGPRACLMNLVDDATGATLCRMGEEETIWAAAGVLQAWIERYGVPQVLYTDWKNIYVPRPREEARLQGEVAETQFGRMCRRLGIRIIAAHSPQAKAYFILHLLQTVRSVVIEAAAVCQSDPRSSARRIGAWVFV